MDLIVDQVDQLDHVHLTDRGAVFERFARTSVVKLDLAVHFSVRIDNVVFRKQFADILFGRAVKYRCCDLPAELFANVP